MAVSKSFDSELSYNILNRINSGNCNGSIIDVKNIPSFENDSIINLSDSNFTRDFDFSKAQNNLKHFTDKIQLKDFGTVNNGKLILSGNDLEKIGLYLLPLVSVGILNGGAATSYTDRIKNKSYNSEIFDFCSTEFELLRKKYQNSPKGITPAYINKNGTYGASFIELKMRSFLLKIDKYNREIGKNNFTYPFFQMTSMQTDKALSDEYIKYRESIYLKSLIEKTQTDITSVLTEVQPLISAFTHSSEGEPKTFFRDCSNNMLMLPGGHGQNFSILKNIYKKLLDSGKKFVYLGNVDNIGFNIDLKEIALLALSGCHAGFDFSLKTPVDVKGGILITDMNGKLNCGDIGAAVSKQDVYNAEKEGKSILFNCATGLFNLEYLVNNIDYIIENLPLRISDQEKEFGKYSQAEQITWEVLSLLDNFLIFGVNKYDRFLASKLLIENMIISRPSCCNDYFNKNTDKSIDKISESLNKGLMRILNHEMYMKEIEDCWQPV